MPRALGVGYDTINDILANRIAVGVLAVLLVGKLVAWWIALGSGTSGGTLAPILLVSGAFGGMLGALVNDIAPGLHVSPGAVALVAMAATFGSATRATFTAIVFAFELTHDYHAILPIMLAAVIADLVAGALLDHGLMTEKLARRGLHVSLDYTPDYLQATLVRDAMTSDVKRPRRSARPSLTRAVSIETISHSAYPLVDDDRRCVGIVSRSDLLGPDADADTPLSTIASTDVVTLAPDDTLADRARTHHRRRGRAPPRGRRRAPHRRHVHPHRHPARPQPAPHRRAEPARLARSVATQTLAGVDRLADDRAPPHRLRHGAHRLWQEWGS